MTSRPILLVEDNPDDVALTLRALKKNQILNPISVASDGAEALKFLFDGGNTNLAEPGLILLDLKLPKVDGLEVLRRIRADERTKVIPVVVLTSSKLEEDILSSYHKRRQRLRTKTSELRRIRRRNKNTRHVLAAPERGRTRVRSEQE